MLENVSIIKTRKTFRFRLYPTKKQVETIDRTIETCRRLYNHFLEERISTYTETGKTVRRLSQQNQIPIMKKDNEDLNSVHSQVLQQVTFRLERAYNNFFRLVKAGTEKSGFPKFKGRKNYYSFCYPQSGFSLTNNRLELSKVGNVKIKLHRALVGHVKTCSIIRKDDKYYACFSCEAEVTPIPLSGKQIGIDVGINNFVITSAGEFFPKLSVYKKSEKRLKYLQRMVSRRKKGSNRRRKATAMLARKHGKVANQRKDIAHKVSTKLIRGNDIIAHEDLQVKNMVKNHKLAKSITDAGWGMLFEFLAYKASDAGRRVIPVPPAHTSQICSDCGELVRKSLSERWHKCPRCGLCIPRDVNAAKNILAIALAI